MGLSYKSLLLFLSSLFIPSGVLILCFSSTTSSAISGNETDLQALLEFKSKITHDPFQVLRSWNETIHFCQWQGVTCGLLHRRVTVLDLHSLKISGSISPYIGNLSFLRALNIQNNSFGHEIPQQIGYLRRLEELRLNNNSVGGKIPTNISRCSNLVFISLGKNKLEGNVPEELGVLSNLQVLSIFGNKLTGSIPHSLGNLSQLQRLSLAENRMVGEVPNSLGWLRNLTFLSLRSNRLSDIGFLLPNIRWFAISSNEFTGKIPVSLSNATNLESLLLLQNNLTGEVPSLAKLDRLRVFSLTSNNLGTGKADDLSFLHSLTNTTALEELGVNGNNFGGMLPDSIANLSTTLRILLLDNNRIIGSIPSGIENLVSLEDFEVWNNQLSGFIPDSIGKLQNLVVLALNSNMLSGHIPSSLGNLTNLIQLLVEDNNLSGRIPSDLGRCQNMLGLSLSQNNFSGSIPPEVISISSLSIYLDLSQNNLTGTLPMEVGNLKSLSEFDVSGNKLSGEIPRTLGSCISLEILNMAGNNFQGLIPSSLSSLRALQILDLSNNHLSGEIPGFLSTPGALQYLNLSYNNFKGMVPSKGIFKNASATSVEGNNMLCGGIPEFQLPVCNSARHKKNRLTPVLKTVIAAISAISGMAFLILMLYLFWFRQKKVNETTADFSEKKIMELSYQNLHKATDGFSSANIIGMGSFGSVYKGRLDREGTLIAVKVFNLMRRGGFKSFLAECEALRNIRHRNLLKVLTACSSLDYHGNDFKALVYEFMVNGSLEEWLHPPVATNEAELETRKLNFLQRLNIAIDVASALYYLHHHCEPQIVHCDLKPSNILLDEELTGHVGDFGLARFLLDATQNHYTQSSSIGVRGTVGYAPPEYGMSSEVSTYGDVYSYGILLLEMFTGKRPMDDMFKDGFNLHNFVKAALPNQVVEIVDPNLLPEIEEGETSTDSADTGRCKTSSNRLMECLNVIFQVGVDCSVEFPRERMPIVDVGRQLASIKDKLVGTGFPSKRQISIL
ncbi:probable LRR receptor-like serine/threonine-protein kinase At3g47570 isoform X2 [Ricinus communis]|uniref:probable LRR receptor-like serine/threonine-protein kinase At3g47570 isoform X2 n=1 Tax=Ricinus communis TaxID=3988 RepID=UPI00201A54FA|nr:probable LRR receptor-like serine/threonine-protein kinase At3g47570 isoform X2 [Ricinus communis]